MNSQIIKFAGLFLGMLILLVSCATAEKPETVMPNLPPATAMDQDTGGISYAANLQPLMRESCSPCHFPERGKKELLDSYHATAKFIDDIIYRVQLSPDSSGFMPFKSKKMPLTLDQIQLFIDWRNAGMPD
jgi:hypothetical protein